MVGSRTDALVLDDTRRGTSMDVVANHGGGVSAGAIPAKSNVLGPAAVLWKLPGEPLRERGMVSPYQVDVGSERSGEVVTKRELLIN
jgi:hypothetical protein